MGPEADEGRGERAAPGAGVDERGRPDEEGAHGGPQADDEEGPVELEACKGKERAGHEADEGGVHVRVRAEADMSGEGGQGDQEAGEGAVRVEPGAGRERHDEPGPGEERGRARPIAERGGAWAKHGVDGSAQVGTRAGEGGTRGRPEADQGGKRGGHGTTVGGVQQDPDAGKEAERVASEDEAGGEHRVWADMESEASLSLSEGGNSEGTVKRFYIGEEGYNQEEGTEDRGGTVKWYYEDRGYGFIAPDGGGRDVFMHRCSVDGDGGRMLRRGQRVSYQETQGRKGRKAVRVRVEAQGPERECEGHEQRDGWGDPGQWPETSAEIVLERIRMAAFALSCRVYGLPPEEWLTRSEEGGELWDELADAVQAGPGAGLTWQAVRRMLAGEGLRKGRSLAFYVAAVQLIEAERDSIQGWEDAAGVEAQRPAG